MNREQAEELWRQRFDEYGLSERFELVGRDWTSLRGGKASVRCKTCGADFETWNIKALFQGKVKALTCPRCGMRSNGQVMLNKTLLADEIVKYFETGHSVQLEGIGTLKPVFNAACADTPEELGNECVRQIKLRFYPHKEFQESMKHLELVDLDLIQE